MRSIALKLLVRMVELLRKMLKSLPLRPRTGMAEAASSSSKLKGRCQARLSWQRWCASSAARTGPTLFSQGTFLLSRAQKNNTWSYQTIRTSIYARSDRQGITSSDFVSTRAATILAPSSSLHTRCTEVPLVGTLSQLPDAIKFVDSAQTPRGTLR